MTLVIIFAMLCGILACGGVTVAQSTQCIQDNVCRKEANRLIALSVVNMVVMVVPFMELTRTEFKDATIIFIYLISFCLQISWVGKSSRALGAGVEENGTD